MPKKKQALPTPKAKLYTEDAALLVPIFQKEPFITFQELQAKYGDILTDLAAARFYIVERARGNIAREHFFKR